MLAAKFWRRESCNLIGPLTIELSTEVNCLRDLLTIFNPTAMAKERVCRGKRVAQRYGILVVLGELSSFLSLLRMASGLTQALSHLEQRSTATVKYVSRFMASCLQICIWRLSASIENISRVVVVSAFYETKQTASIFRQESTDNSVNLTISWCLVRAALSKMLYLFLPK